MIEHTHPRASTTRLQQRFLWSLLLNAGLAIGEIIMSILTNSTALLADGLNNVDDVGALLLSIYSERKAKMPPDERLTFGGGRIDVLAGFAKGCFLLISAFLVLFQVGHFLLEPPDVIDGKVVLIVGVTALIVNLLSALWLRKDSCHSLNAKGTYLCMIYDAVGSLAVVASGFLSMIYGFIYFDVIASLLITFFMVKSGLSVMKECIPLFLQTAPESFDFDAFEKAVCAIAHVSSVGDVHVWSLTPQEHHLTCKVTVDEEDICVCEQVLSAVEKIAQDFGIQHATVQPVYTSENLKRFCA